MPQNQVDKDFIREQTRILAESAYQLLEQSDPPPPDNDPRKHFKCFLNPDNCSYRLPRSHDFRTLEDILNYKPFRAYYPQSMIDIPAYFSNNNIEPFHEIRPIDDYAYGVATIAQMVVMTSNDMYWRLERSEDLPEIIDYLERYLMEFEFIENALPAIQKVKLNQVRVLLTTLTNELNKQQFAKMRRERGATKMISLYERLANSYR